MSFPSTIITRVYSCIGLADKYPMKDYPSDSQSKDSKPITPVTPGQNRLSLGEVPIILEKDDETAKAFSWNLKPDDSSTQLSKVMKNPATTQGKVLTETIDRINQGLGSTQLTKGRFAELYSSLSVCGPADHSSLSVCGPADHIEGMPNFPEATIGYLEEGGPVQEWNGPLYWRFE